MLEEMYIKLNRFRIDLDHLQSYTEDEFGLRVYDNAIVDTEFPIDTEHYICYDDKHSLEKRDIANLKYPLRACSKRGMLRQGGGVTGKENFLKDIADAQDWSNGKLKEL